jgi:hypothetical protein
LVGALEELYDIIIIDTFQDIFDPMHTDKSMSHSSDSTLTVLIEENILLTIRLFSTFTGAFFKKCLMTRRPILMVLPGPFSRSAF